jgi:hypothetical protein
MKIGAETIRSLDPELFVVLLIQHIVLSNTVPSNRVIASPEGKIGLTFVLLDLKVVDLAVAFR